MKLSSQLRTLRRCFGEPIQVRIVYQKKPVIVGVSTVKDYGDGDIDEEDGAELLSSKKQKGINKGKQSYHG